MSLQREKRPKFKMWKSLMHRKRKYSEQQLPCDRESYAALAAMQGGSAATLPPSLDALRACEYGRLLLIARWRYLQYEVLKKQLFCKCCKFFVAMHFIS